MNDTQKRKLDKGQREEAFMADNAGDFPGGSPGALAATKHTDIISEIQGLAAQQVSGFAGAQAEVDIKDLALETMKEFIDQMNRAANGFADEIPGSDMQFRKPRNRSQANIRATAQAFHDDAVPLEQKFIDWGLDTKFLDKLQTAINDYDAAVLAEDTSEGHQAEATGGLRDAFKRLMKNGKKLDSVVRIRYNNNPAKLAAWTVASHLEKPPAKKKAAGDPPTP